MSTTIQTADRFTALPDERTLAETVVALEERGFSVEVVDDLDAARERVLARIPEGSSVMTNPSVTLGVHWNRAGDRRRRALRLGTHQGARARPRNATAGDQGDHGPARVLPRQRPRDHARRNGSSSPLPWAASSPPTRGARPMSSSSSAPRSSCPTSLRHTNGSTSTASSSRMPAPSRPTGRTVASARSSRSTKRTPAASTSSSSVQSSGSDAERDATTLGAGVLAGVTAGAAVLSCGV